ETYSPPDPEYRILCEQSFKEIYTPCLNNETYHYTLFVSSYVQKIFDLFPILNILSFNKEEEIKKLEQKGQISTQFSNVNFLQLSASQIIDLFKEKLEISHTLALEEQTCQYEEKLRNYHHLVLDDERGFRNFCLTKAKISSDKVSDEIWETLKFG